MNQIEIQTRLERATGIIHQIRLAEGVLDELFFSRPTVSVAPPPIDFFHRYTETAYESVARARETFAASMEDTVESATEKTGAVNPTDAGPIAYPENFGELIGQRIRCARLDRGITQNDLAKETGIRRPNIARLEKGLSLPNLSTLLKVSSALQIPITNLLLFT
jgi:DNA-binding XRE family transcriptional regulator